MRCFKKFIHGDADLEGLYRSFYKDGQSIRSLEQGKRAVEQKNQALEQKNLALEQKNLILEHDKQQLQSQVKKLKRQNSKLTRQLEEANKKCEKKDRESKRTHTPFSRGSPKPNPKKPGRKSGKRHGKKGRRNIPAVIDKQIEVPLPPKCIHCGSEQLKVEEKVPQYQTEIEFRKVTRQFNIEVGHCQKCGGRVQGRDPLQTSDALGAACSQVGSTAQALIVYLNKQLGLSYGKICELMKDAFELELTRGAAAQIVRRTALRTQNEFAHLVEKLRTSPVVNMDETGWKIAGRLNWLWAFVTPDLVVYTIKPCRGGIVAEELLGEDYSGKLGHDGLSAYDRFPKAVHQQCLWHGLERCKRILQQAKGNQRRFAEFMRKLFKKGLKAYDKIKCGKMSKRGALICRGHLQAQLRKQLDKPWQYEENVRFAKHLDKHFEQWFNFLKYPDLLEPTNNSGERAIRPAVTYRKVWGGNRTEEGAETQAALTSIFQTLKKQGKKILDFVKEIARAKKPSALGVA